MTTTKTIKCGLCNEVIIGAVRDLNRHKAEKHPEERAAMRANRKARLRRGASINRCESCNKFVSLEPGEPEDGGIDVDVDGNISGSVRLTLCCAECSTELAETTVEIEESVDIEHEETCTEEDRSLSLSLDSIDIDEEGGGRFSKHLYFVSVSATVLCDSCGADSSFSTVSDKAAASYFEQV